MKYLGWLLALLAAAFYVAWPAYSGYSIKTALEAGDKDGLSAKIDFDRVRASLRPAVAAKVENELAIALRKAGPAAGALNDQLKAKIMPRLVDGVLQSLVTPETLIRIHQQGGNLKSALDSIVAERAAANDGIASLIGGIDLGGGAVGSSSGSGLGKLGEIAGKFGIDPNVVLGGLKGKTAEAEKPAAIPAAQKGNAPRYGLDNIKHLGLNGPLGLAIGVARDPAAKDADLTAELSFDGGDWKLTGLIPKI